MKLHPSPGVVNGVFGVCCPVSRGRELPCGPPAQSQEATPVSPPPEVECVPTSCHLPGPLPKRPFAAKRGHGDWPSRVSRTPELRWWLSDECASGKGSGEGISLPQRGSRAKPAPSWLRRSAAFRGRSPREVRGCGGEETGRLWITSIIAHATAWSASSGVL